MTDTFDRAAAIGRLNDLTGWTCTPLGDFTYDLILRHAALVADNAVLEDEIEAMHAGITVEAVIGPPTINDYAELDDLTPRERAMREVVDQYATENDRLIADRDHMAVVFGQALNALDPDQYAGLRARIVLCIASTQVDANTH